MKVEIFLSKTGYRAEVSFWAPGFVYAGAINPFEGAVLTLKDGTVIESDSKVPDVLSFSGGPSSADSETLVLFYSVPHTARLSKWVLRCGLGVLECEVEDEIAQLIKEEPDRY